MFSRVLWTYGCITSAIVGIFGMQFVSHWFAFLFLITLRCYVGALR